MRQYLLVNATQEAAIEVINETIGKARHRLLKAVSLGDGRRVIPADVRGDSPYWTDYQAALADLPTREVGPQDWPATSPEDA